jgi:hypothetical protein
MLRSGPMVFEPVGVVLTVQRRTGNIGECQMTDAIR